MLGRAHTHVVNRASKQARLWVNPRNVVLGDLQAEAKKGMLLATRVKGALQLLINRYG